MSITALGYLDALPSIATIVPLLISPGLKRSTKAPVL